MVMIQAFQRMDVTMFVEAIIELFFLKIKHGVEYEGDNEATSLMERSFGSFLIWSLKLPSKLIFFVWQCANDILFTNLIKRGWNLTLLCSLFGVM